MRPLIVLLLALAVAGCDRGKPETPQPAADTVATSVPANAATPEMPKGSKLDTSHAGEALPTAAFTGPDGAPATLAAHAGKPLIVNLWATWCAPCLAEMPTLDALAGREKDRLHLMVVSQDLAGKREVDPYFATHKFTALQPYLDKQNVLMDAVKADTLPVTILYGADGKERWRVVGGMDWTGADAKALIDKALT
ncbi:TlpA family protein disulfide reductase [Sphingomonas montana]|uniref:TlpA family protein disulfide reductase n=1 Tax=Sphingomonas montana TaxID=1843236 RepID=UPI001F0B6BA7|nr:TlpA disulfide reductase family protein [Sphingomonas montana]